LQGRAHENTLFLEPECVQKYIRALVHDINVGKQSSIDIVQGRLDVLQSRTTEDDDDARGSSDEAEEDEDAPPAPRPLISTSPVADK
jgi:hypothetical protein